MLKKEMGYFARVTKRTSPSASTNDRRKINAVLMGRKTWESIPERFRPLKDRLNVVVTRQPEEFKAQINATRKVGSENGEEGPLVCTGLVDALEKLQNGSALPSADLEIDRVYVIGGGSVYTTALELPQTKRVLLTKIHKEYECDTHFPVNLEQSAVWRKAERQEVAEFTGEDISAEGVEEQGVKFEFGLYERV